MARRASCDSAFRKSLALRAFSSIASVSRGFLAGARLIPLVVVDVRILAIRRLRCSIVIRDTDPIVHLVAAGEKRSATDVTGRRYDIHLYKLLISHVVGKD